MRRVAGEVQLEGGGREVAQAVGVRRPFRHAGGEADGGGGEDADQHGGAHAPRQQRGDQQQAEDGQRRALVAAGCRASRWWRRWAR